MGGGSTAGSSARGGSPTGLPHIWQNTELGTRRVPQVQEVGAGGGAFSFDNLYLHYQWQR
jgi:hypothetical protein